MLAEGTKFKFKDNLKPGRRYGKCPYVDYMDKFKGEVMTIEMQCCDNPQYTVKEHGFCVSEEMVEVVK